MFANTKDFFKNARGQITSIIRRVKNFIDDVKDKFHNLYQTNYDTGMYHLERGNLWDAAFRFKIIKRFWPDMLDAQYKYAYCLVLQGFNSDAKTLLKEILVKDQNYTQAKELLEKVENNDTEKVIADFKAKLDKNVSKTSSRDETSR